MTGTTQNKARRNGLAIVDSHDHDSNENRFETIEICGVETDGEPHDEFVAAYRVNADDSYTYIGSCYVKSGDFPAHIRSEQHLRDLLPEFARMVC